MLFVAGIDMAVLPKVPGIRTYGGTQVMIKVKKYTSSCSKDCRIVVRRDGEEYVVVKGTVPRSLKLQFKILCVEKGLEMSSVLEDLIEKWIQADAPVPKSPTDLFDEDSEVVKGYVPKFLKFQFKVLCIQKRVKISSVLHNLINGWVEVGGSTETRF